MRMAIILKLSRNLACLPIFTYIWHVMRLLLAAFIILYTACGGAVMAQTYDSSYRDWSVYTYRGSCYIGSAPIRQAGNYSRRGQPYILVIHRNATLEELNVSSGYPYKKGKEVIATIDNKRYKLFTEGEIAWAYDSNQDREMVAAMKRGKRMKIRGTSTRGTWSEDEYSLMGFSAAHKRMKSLCR